MKIQETQKTSNSMIILDVNIHRVMSYHVAILIRFQTERHYPSKDPSTTTSPSFINITNLKYKTPPQQLLKMALAPKFAGQKFTATNTPTLHTLELYLDYVCPYSAKMFNTVYTSVLPLIKQKYASKVQILFRQQIQPWHPSSTLVHEAGVAVLKLQPSKFYDFSKVSSYLPYTRAFQTRDPFFFCLLSECVIMKMST